MDDDDEVVLQQHFSGLLGRGQVERHGHGVRDSLRHGQVDQAGHEVDVNVAVVLVRGPGDAVLVVVHAVGRGGGRLAPVLGGFAPGG